MLKSFLLGFYIVLIIFEIINMYPVQCIFTLPVIMPYNLSENANMEGELKIKKAKFKQLSAAYKFDTISHRETSAQFFKRVGDKYDKLFDDILGGNPSPEVLANLAIWALKKTDLWSDSIYFGLFFGNIELLSKIKSDVAKYELWKIRLKVQLTGNFDGHFAESITEAEELQNQNNFNFSN